MPIIEIKGSQEPFTIFFELKRDYRETFLRKGDKVVAYSERSCGIGSPFRWNLVEEIRRSDDWDAELKEMTTILFEDLLKDDRNRVWAEGARSVFIGFVNTLLHHSSQQFISNNMLIKKMQEMSIAELIRHLSVYQGNRGLLRDYFDIDLNEVERKGFAEYMKTYHVPRKGTDIMMFFGNVLEKFGGLFKSVDGADTLHDYFSGKYGRRLFLVYDYQKRDSSIAIFRYFLKKIIDERLSQDVEMNKKVVMVLDEIAEVNSDFGLMPAVTIGRGNNLQLFVITQSLEKLHALAPKHNAEHYTNASLAGFPILTAFMPGDPQSIEAIQKLFGKHLVEITALPASRFAPEEKSVMELPVVRYEEFASLGLGEFYIKIRNAFPEKVKLNL